MSARIAAAYAALALLVAALTFLVVGAFVALAHDRAEVDPARLPRYSESSPIWAVYDATVKET